MQLKSGSEFHISESLRSKIASFSHRLCSLDEIKKEKRRIIVVGDYSARFLHEHGVNVFLEVVDLKTKREPSSTYRHVSGSVSVRNPPGVLTHDLFSTIERMMKVGGRIEVMGEEDLAVIPIIFYSDLDTVVVYGVPDVGMACIEVDRNIKALVSEIIGELETYGGT
ncbi:DUF359 domain-containing protein [Thermoplasmatales archaeon AK]|nr:DUF359 domain-containing protein [Thermoplasmatales archaeon AK]